MKLNIRKDLLIFLISLFILQACKKEGDIGLEQQIDEEGLSGALIDTSTIRTFSVKDDSLISSRYVRNQLGEFQDPLFGNTKASIAFQAVLSQNNVNFGTNPVLDSIVLVMGYIVDNTARYYGDTNSVMEINVQQLDEDITEDSVYYSNRVFRTKSEIIGTVNYRPNPKDSITVQNIRDGRPDTVAKLPPHLRIRLKDSFGQELLSKSGSIDLSENTVFLNTYKGFNITAKRLSGEGGIMSFDLTNSNRSYIVLYYKNSTDTTNFIFNINSVAANINRYEHNYAGTEVFTQLGDSTLGQTKTFIQSLAGLRGKLSFPNIKRLTDSGMVAVNKAELIVKPYMGTESPYAPIAQLSLKARRVDNTEFIIQTATYNASKKEYRLVITNYIQQYVAGKLDVKELYLEDASKQIRPNRLVLSGQNSADPIQLRVFYTKLY